MEIGAIFMIVAVLLLVSLFVSRPLLERSAETRLPAEQAARKAQDHQRSTLLAERDRVLNALQELDFDNAVGKIPPEDYPLHRSALLESGAEALRQLDIIDAEEAPSGSVESPEDRLEAEVAARRADAGERSERSERKPLPSADKDDLERLISSRRRSRQEKATGFCPKCGRPLQKSDRFCSSCGASI